MPEVIITAAPLAPPCPSGKPGASGLWHADAHLPTGAIVWGRGHGEATARRNAERRALEELRAHLTACELEQQAREAGDVDTD